MTQPTKYTQNHDYSDELTSSSVPGSHGAHLDTEFAELKSTTDAIIDNLALIQRDDGELKNASVHPDAFDSASLAIMGGSWLPRGAWATATVYAVGDVISQGGAPYVCAANHTAGTFSTDLTAVKWIALGGTGATIAFTPSGNIAAVTMQLAIVELDNEKAGLALNNTFTGTNTFNGSVTLGASADLALGRNATVAGTLGVTGNVTLSGTLGVTGAATLGSTLSVTGNTTVGGTLGVTGATTLTGAATINNSLTVTGAVTVNGATVLNEAGADADTRIEGDTETHLFFVDASTDRIGFKTATPSTDVELASSVNRPLDIQITNSNAGNNVYAEFRASNGTGACDFGIVGTGFSVDVTTNANEGFLISESTSAGLLIKHNGDSYIRFSKGISGVVQEVARLGSTGALALGTTFVTGSAKGNIIVPNNTTYMSVNAAGNGLKSLLYCDSGDRTALSFNGGALVLDTPVTTGGIGADVGHFHVRIGGTNYGVTYHNIT